jgi:hypothetical protein
MTCSQPVAGSEGWADHEVTGALRRLQIEHSRRLRAKEIRIIGAGEGNRTLDTQLGKFLEDVDNKQESCKPGEPRSLSNQPDNKSACKPEEPPDMP